MELNAFRHLFSISFSAAACTLGFVSLPNGFLSLSVDSGQLGLLGLAFDGRILNCNLLEEEFICLLF